MKELKIIKRNGDLVDFDKSKIVLAIEKAMMECDQVDSKVSKQIADDIENSIKQRGIQGDCTVEEVQDLVEMKLMGFMPTVAKKYILYREERSKVRNNGWEMTDLQRDIYEKKYRQNNETFDEFLNRVSGGDEYIKKLIKNKKFISGGRILAGRGMNEFGKKMTYSNCFVIEPPQDNIESIFKSASDMARVFSYGGGVGLTLKNLRPRNALVNNSAKTSSGSVSFMDLYSTTTEVIAQAGRRAALILTLPVTHPDIEEFIDIKNDLNKVTKANISVGITDDFMKAVKNDEDWDLEFVVETEGIKKEYKKTVKAKDLFRKIAQSAWNMAEPGVLFWDNINNYHINDHNPNVKYEACNPCVSADTLILTDKGNVPIVERVGIPTNVWNGECWSEVIPEITGYNQPMFEVEFSNGSKLKCTDYHRFTLENGEVKEAKELNLGDSLQEWKSANGDCITNVKVIKKTRIENADVVYCFNEPLLHKGVFNGVLTSQCGEKPLIENATCLLGSFNLSEYVKKSFTNNAHFDFDAFKKDIPFVVKYMDDLLEEGIPFLPLQQQRQVAIDWRQIGIGVMGLHDMLIKLMLKYGTQESLDFVDSVMRVLGNEALKASALLAKEKGSYLKYNKDKVLQSKYIDVVASNETKNLIEQYGLRNSEIISIAPTGSISTMFGVSGGTEPVFQFIYTRKTESLHGQDTYYKIFTPIVKQYMEANSITDIEDLPDYFIQSQDIPYINRIKMQAVLQKYVDSAISSTVNLPKEITIEEVEDLYMLAWEHGLKGITIYRDGCARAGILITDNTTTDKKSITELQVELNNAILESLKQNPDICPMCGITMIHTNGCHECQNCGYSPCSI